MRRGRIPGLWIGAVAVIIGVIVLIGLFDHGPPPSRTATGNPTLFSSVNGGGRSAVATPSPNDTNIYQWNGAPPLPVPRHFVPPAAASVQSARRTPAAQPKQAAQAQTPQENASTQALASQFPVFAHQVFETVPGSGSDTEYFAALGNLINGSPIPAGTPIPPTADHLAHAQADIDRGDVTAALGELRSLPGPAAQVMGPWRAAAEGRLAMNRPRAVSPRGLAQNVAPSGNLANAVPAEIPPYARESTGPSAR